MRTETSIGKYLQRMIYPNIVYFIFLILFYWSWSDGLADSGVCVEGSLCLQSASYQSCKGGGATLVLLILIRAVLRFSFLDIGLLSSPSLTGARTGDITKPLPEIGPARVSAIPYPLPTGEENGWRIRNDEAYACAGSISMPSCSARSARPAEERIFRRI